MKKLRILGALLRKELLLLKRNSLIPKILVMMPLVVMLVFPLVANMDVKNVRVAVVDNDRSQLSRQIISDINAAESLLVNGVYSTHDAALATVEDGATDVVLSIPANYERNLMQGKVPAADIEANGVNATKGSIGAGYVAQSAGRTLAQWQRSIGRDVKLPEVSVINRFNPTLKFRNYMIPGMMVILIIILCGFIPTLDFMREKESGTIEAMNVTPVGRFVFVLSILIPFWVVGILVITIGMVVGWLVYGLIPVGNIGSIYLAAVLFSLVMSGIGVTVANKSATMIQSVFVMFAFTMIFMLMSGLFTPITSMPDWAMYLTYIIPPRYYIEVMRAIYLKGTPINELWPQFVALSVFAVGFCVLAALTYRKRN